MGEMSWNQSLTRWSKLCMFLGEWFSWKVFFNFMGDLGNKRN
jgi:hypothetical protein